MRPAYSDIKYNKAEHVAGICNVLITPREWLLENPVIDFETGRVLITLSLKTGKFWMQLELTQRSYDFLETQKTSKTGDYYEIAASGLMNIYDYALHQVLQTLRYSEVVVVLTDRNKRRRLVGNIETGMKLTTIYQQKNSPAGEESLQINLSAQSEDPALFYNADNTPEIFGNFLVDSDGAYLLVE